MNRDNVLEYTRKLNVDLAKLVFIHVFRHHITQVHDELLSLLRYYPETGLVDEEGKRFNWRNLASDNLKPYYEGPIHTEFKCIGKLTEGPELPNKTINLLPERYIYSIDERYDLPSTSIDLPSISND